MVEETLDIVNESDQVVAEGTREFVHRSGLWHRGAHVFLFTPDGSLVVQQRSKRRLHSPGMLDCSVSEHVLAGESYREAAERGLREELGLIQVALASLVRFRMDYGPGDNMVGVLFRGVVTPDAIRIDHNEVDQVLFRSIPELNQLLLDERARFSRWFRQILLWYLGEASEIQLIDAHE